MELKGLITSLAFGGEGIVRNEGFVIFIPFALPGDYVAYRILEKKKNFARGELIEVITKSPQRIDPLCPYFGICGGCQFQNLTYEGQLTYKRQFVEDALKRIGGLTFSEVLPVIPSKSWAYRRHVQLTLLPKDNFFQAGYYSLDNSTLVPISQCPIFEKQENEIFKIIQEFTGRLSSEDNDKARLTLLKQEEKYILEFAFKKLPTNASTLTEEFLNKYPVWKGVILTEPGKILKFGRPQPSLVIEDLHFDFSLGAFIQNHPEQSLNIYRMIRDLAEGSSPKSILDLYCGIGISSLLLAKKGFKVTGVEWNKEAIEMAIDNGKKNGLQQAVFIQADVKKALKEALKKAKPEFILVNPPRVGMDKSVLEGLLTSHAKEIIYVSCMPSTLARDLSILCKEKYAILTIQPFDMFPQTSHIETLVHLRAR